jgi:hypothetical protein
VFIPVDDDLKKLLAGIFDAELPWKFLNFWMGSANQAMNEPPALRR